MFGKATRGKRLKSADRIKGSLPFVTAGEADEGISDYIANDVEVFSNNTITIDMFGSAKYRNYKYGGDDHVAVVHTEKIPKFAAVFITAAIHKASYTGKFSYARNFYAKDADELDVMLPTKKGTPDFEFMESFVAELEAERVAELEAERVAELEAYLLATGLKDYKLTTRELTALDDFKNCNVEFGEFTFEKIFNRIAQGRRLKKEDQVSGEIPFVMAGVTNNGVVNYVSNPVATFPENSITIDIFGNTFYRNFAFGAGDDTGVYWNDEEKYTKELMLFFATSMRKALVGKFSYGKKLRSSQSLKQNMILLTKNNKPNYEIMETLISAIQKLVIKDVVLYSEQKMRAVNAALDNR